MNASQRPLLTTAERRAENASTVVARVITQQTVRNRDVTTVAEEAIEAEAVVADVEASEVEAEATTNLRMQPLSVRNRSKAM